MKKYRVVRGFTLIELMVVIVIIGILVAIALPNFIGAQERAKQASVKGNMHTLQVMVETYAVDWGGLYPNTAPALFAEANNQGYWKELTNPYNGMSGLDISYDFMPVFATVNANDNTVHNGSRGIVYFKPQASLLAPYSIYGKAGNDIFVKDKNQVFFLSNQ